MTHQRKVRLIRTCVVAGVCGTLAVLAYVVKSRTYFLDHWEEEHQE